MSRFLLSLPAGIGLLHSVGCVDAADDWGQEVDQFHKKLLNPPEFKLVDLLDGEREGMVEDAGKLPVVFMHGMGDKGTNPGMKSMCNKMASLYSVYTVCLDVADGFSSITTPMDDQLTQLTKTVQADPKLKGGFNAMGISQGGLLVRAYINRVNNPPVKSDYWKDSKDKETYLRESRFLADVNNERAVKNATYKTNMLGLDMYMLIEANPDGVITPRASSSHGYYKWGTNSDKDVELMRDTEAYKEDWLGLKTLDQQGKIVQLEYRGQHVHMPHSMMLNQVLPELAKTGPPAKNTASMISV